MMHHIFSLQFILLNTLGSIEYSIAIVFSSSECGSRNFHEPLRIVHFIFNLKTAWKSYHVAIGVFLSPFIVSVIDCYIFLLLSLSSFSVWPSKLPKSNAMPNKFWFGSNIRVENGNFFLWHQHVSVARESEQDLLSFTLIACVCVCLSVGLAPDDRVASQSRSLVLSVEASNKSWHKPKESAIRRSCRACTARTPGVGHV